MVTRRLLPTLLGLVLVALLGLVRLSDPPPVAAIRDMGFDFYQRIHPRAGTNSLVRVVDIDDASLSRLGQWPWPRSMLATLTSRLHELGAAAIGYDLLFPEPDRLGAENDAAFAASLAASNSVLGFSVSPNAPHVALTPKTSIAVSGSHPGASLPPMSGVVAPLPVLRDAAAGLGGLSLNAEDSAGTVRRVPMLWADGESLIPGLAIEVLRLAAGVQTLVALGDTSGGNTLEGIRVGPFNVETTASGEVVLYDKPPSPEQVIAAASVLGESYLDLREQVAGRIVLIGTSASGLLDLHATPLSASTPGVLIHAAVIDQIVSGQFLSRADWVQGLELLIMAAAGVLLVITVLRLGPRAGLLVALALVGAVTATSYTAFATRGWLIDATYPAAAALLVYTAMVYFQFSLTERNRQELRRAFGYYVAPELLSRIERSADQLKLGGEAREITVMFADMRGFTAFTEGHKPTETLRMLNTLFGALGKEIVDRDGTIDKFIGDSIMAFWNAPLDVVDHARKAAEAALAMRTRLADLNREGKLSGVAIGIGLSTGEALVGNMGLESRFDYSAIGDSVNVASRVEGESKIIGYDTVAADPTRRALPDFAWLEAGSVQLQGKSKRIPIHILIGDAALAETPEFVALHDAHLNWLGGRGDLAATAVLAARVDPRLARFYELIPGRADDFASPA